ncbi:unnamed protein product, partial [Amoebophrya sp. A25]
CTTTAPSRVAQPSTSAFTPRKEENGEEDTDTVCARLEEFAESLMRRLDAHEAKIRQALEERAGEGHGEHGHDRQSSSRCDADRLRRILKRIEKWRTRVLPLLIHLVESDHLDKQELYFLPPLNSGLPRVVDPWAREGKKQAPTIRGPSGILRPAHEEHNCRKNEAQAGLHTTTVEQEISELSLLCSSTSSSSSRVGSSPAKSPSSSSSDMLSMGKKRPRGPRKGQENIVLSGPAIIILSKKPPPPFIDDVGDENTSSRRFEKAALQKDASVITQQMDDHAQKNIEDTASTSHGLRSSSSRPSTSAHSSNLHTVEASAASIAVEALEESSSPTTTVLPWVMDQEVIFMGKSRELTPLSLFNSERGFL